MQDRKEHACAGYHGDCGEERSGERDDHSLFLSHPETDSGQSVPYVFQVPILFLMSQAAFGQMVPDA
jgi:hypothetical protein